jgi:hypothetical protein
VNQYVAKVIRQHQHAIAMLVGSSIEKVANHKDYIFHIRAVQALVRIFSG